MKIIAKAAFSAVMLGVVLSGCGDDDDGSTEVSAPPAGSVSAQFAVALPQGSELMPGEAQAGSEAYQIANDVSLAEVEAFYARETDGRAHQDFEWCGKVLTTRLWHRPGAEPDTEDVLELFLDASSPVVVRMSQRVSPPLTCPPEPPEGSG